MFKLYIIHDIIALDLIELTAKLAGITWAAGSSFAHSESGGEDNLDSK